MQYGMIGYYVPPRVYPAGYHCDPKQPLPFASLGSQKNHMALYLMCIYVIQTIRTGFRKHGPKTGKKLDMGKFVRSVQNTLKDLALDVIGEQSKRVPAKKYIAYCEATIKSSKDRQSARKPAKPAEPKGSNRQRLAKREKRRSDRRPGIASA